MIIDWTHIVAALLVTAGVAADVFLILCAVRALQDLAMERRSLHNHRSSSRTPFTENYAMPKKKHPGALALAGLSCFAAPTFGRADSAPLAANIAASAPLAQDTGQSTTAEAPGSAFTVQLNFDFTTAYFYHGIIQEDSGLIFQPAARLFVNLYQEDDWKVDAMIGMWNSFHGQKTAASTNGDFSEYWYEADLIGGFIVTKDKLSLTTTYTFLTSPSDAYETVQELDFTLAFDDTDLLGKFALHPYALLGIETGADASDGADSDAGTYLELGIAPGFSFDLGRTPVSITFPTSVGLSLKDYYQDAAGDDDTFGFVRTGVKASLPLPFGERYGAWTLYGGVYGLFLGDQTSDYNAGDDTEVFATVGLQVNF